MRCALLLAVLLGTAGCATAPWGWQDLRTPARTGAEGDLADCRSHAAAQYAPGVPAGDPYLKNQPAAWQLDPDAQANAPGTGPWHPDREPFPTTGGSQVSQHGVVVPYTGYPGTLDYHPEYLDALVEKCMADRGWAFRPLEQGSK